MLKRFRSRKAKSGQYKLTDVLNTTKRGGIKCLGEFKGNEVYLLSGKYCVY